MIQKCIPQIMKEHLLLLKDLLQLKKSYKHVRAVLENVYIDKLDYILNEYNNKYHRTIQMKPIEIKDNTDIMCAL